MRVRIRHAVPVRWRPPRSGSDRIALHATTTEVEIPEVDAAAFGPRRSYVLDDKGSERAYHVHAGRCWRRVLASMAVPGHVGFAAADHAAFAAALEAGPHAATTPGLFRPLTPLAPLPHGAGGLPDAILARAAADHTETVRAALRAWVSENLALGGDGSVHVSRGMPVIAPLGSQALLDEAPASLSEGPVFEHPRLNRMPRFCAVVPARNDAMRFVFPFERTFGDVPYDGRDLDLFLRDGPAQAERLGRLLRERVGDAHAHESAFAPLRSYADLGLVGAAPDGDRVQALDLLDRALTSLRHGLPDGYDPPMLRWLTFYHDRVARLAFPRPELPEDDLDSLAGLSQSP